MRRIVTSDADIRADIAAQLGRKSTPLLVSTALWDGVRHRLGDRGILQRRLLAVLATMLADGTVEEVPSARKGYERYRLTNPVGQARR